MAAFELLRDQSISVAAITTVNNININQLSAIKNILIEKGISRWQLQIGLPMGNLKTNKDLTLKPEQIDQLIDFAYSTIDDKDFYVYLAHGVGYYNKKEIALQNKCAGMISGSCTWMRCGAGKDVMGILHNGDIVGCTSIRDKSFIEGNVKATPVKDIWNNPNAFSWNRSMSKDRLSGFCNKCKFGSVCKGGCANYRLTFNGDLYSENRYCSYKVAVDKAEIEKAITSQFLCKVTEDSDLFTDAIYY